MTLAESADFAQRTSLNKKSFAAVPSGKSGKGKSKDVENGNGNHQPSADKSFYENLPFHGLKSPPKQVVPLKEREIESLLTYYLSIQVLNPKSDDHLDYADADYKDLYAEGPLGYKAASKQAKKGKRL